LTGKVAKNPATVAEREALARFIGRAVTGANSISVVLDDVDRLLRENGIFTGGLAEAVIALEGPVVNRQHEQRLVDDAWSAAHEPLRRLGETVPPWRPWAERISLRRRVTDPVAAQLLAARAAVVLSLLPADGVLLAVLANRSLHDSHALDTGSALASLVLTAIRSLDPEADLTPRSLWESCGVALDELSSTVLVHALPYSSREQSQSSSLPHYLTFQQLDRLDLFADDLTGIEVFVCENPSVIAAAADIRSRPLVCLRGQPSAATMRLLTQLDGAGVTFRYHGDFDWGGIRIANGLFRRFGFTPWRFEAKDYRRVVADNTTPVLGTPVAAEWDPFLADAMIELGIKVEEESVLADLVRDLAMR